MNCHDQLEERRRVDRDPDLRARRARLAAVEPVADVERNRVEADAMNWTPRVFGSIGERFWQWWRNRSEVQAIVIATLVICGLAAIPVAFGFALIGWIVSLIW
jgi:hypothetical protein